MKKITLALACFYLCFASTSALSQNDPGWSVEFEMDKDHDGLIEINSLQRLEEVRNNPKGDALFGNSKGCPESGCVGFELTQDLDFDSNGDGKIDHQDRYWNDGEGWDPIWFFEAIFEGNNYTIKNLYSNRPNAIRSGFIGWAEGATIRNLRVSGSIRAPRLSGGIVGHLIDSEIENCVSAVNVTVLEKGAGGLVGASSGSTIVGNSASGNVIADDDAGGLVGNAGNSLIINNSSSGRVTGSTDVGGLIGYSIDSTIEENAATGDVEGGDAGGLIGYLRNNFVMNNYSTARVRNDGSAGGLIGKSSDMNFISKNYTASAVTRANSDDAHGALIGVYIAGTLEANHWATDTGVAGDESSSGGATLAKLKCPTSANNISCTDTVLYDSWHQSIWDFGTSDDLPRLRTTSNFPWTNTDTPNASGDHEGTHRLEDRYSERYCDNPIAIEAVVDGSPLIYRSEPDRVFEYFNVFQGLACDKTKQPNGKCDDYEVSYLCHNGWSSWRSDDTPNGYGDVEKRGELECVEPTEIRARKKSSNDIFYGTPDKLKHFSTTKGLTCINKDQKEYKSTDCHNYKVRLVCPTLSEI